MAPIKTVAVVGGSGALGSQVVLGLLEAKTYEVSVVVRDGSKQFPAGIRVITTDYSTPSLEEGLKGQDAVVIALGPEGMDFGPKIADAAVKNGVKRIFPSEWGSDSSNPVFDEITLFRQKDKNTNYIKSKESEGLTWTAVENGAFTDWGLNVGFLGADLKNHKMQIWDSGDKKFSTTPLRTIGRAVAAILSPEHYDATSNKTVRIESFAVSLNEIKASAERVTGKTFEVKHETSAETAAASRKAIAEGDYIGGFGLMKVILLGDQGVGAFSDSDPNVEIWNKKLGLPEDNLDDVIRDVVKGQA